MLTKGPHSRLVEDTDEFHQNVWRKDELVVVHEHALFPDKCVTCNQPANGRTARKMIFWHTPVLLPILLLSWPFYVAFALLFKRTLRVEIPLCKRHLWQRLISTGIGVSLLPTAIWMVYIAIAYSKPSLILSGILCFIVGGVLLGWGRNPIWAVRIRGEYD